MMDEPDCVESKRPPVEDLAWATTEELLEELSRRHEAFIFVYQKEQQGNAKNSVHNLNWYGGIAAAHGLAIYAARSTAVALNAIAEE